MIKALHITYRFGKEIIGGAEYFHYKLAQYLAKSGVEITVVSTKTQNVPHLTRFGVRWDNSLTDFEDHDGIKVYRFKTLNLPKPAMGILGKFLQSRFYTRLVLTHFMSSIKLRSHKDRLPVNAPSSGGA